MYTRPDLVEVGGNTYVSSVLLSCFRSIVKIAVGLEDQINSEQKKKKRKRIDMSTHIEPTNRNKPNTVKR